MSEEFGFLYAPYYENEVVLLFGLLMPKLESKYVINEFSGSFPDCIALRDGIEIGIEFEVNSQHFLVHRHDQDPNLKKCQLIVCWENAWNSNERIFIDVDGNSYKIVVLALKDFLEKNKLAFVKSDKPKYNKILWNEESFFSELRKKTDEKVFARIAEVYAFCVSHNDFNVAFGQGKKIAGFNVAVKRWQRDNIGVPAPIQGYSDGNIAIDYRKLPRNLESQLRQITGDPRNKTGKPKRWQYFNMKNDTDLEFVKQALKWVSN